MARAPKPLFLGRSSYRQRRLADAARALPVFGAVLLAMPLLWAGPDGGAGAGGTAGGGALASDLVYLLVLWLGLILVAAGLARGLSDGKAADEKAVGGAPDAPGGGGAGSGDAAPARARGEGR